MLVVDGSGSISSAEFELAREFARTLVNSCLFVPGSRAGVVEYSSNIRLIAGLVSDRDAVLTAIENMPQSGRNTATGDAINRAQQELSSIASPNSKQLILVLTDGDTNEGVPAASAADAARATGTELFAIGVGTGDNAELRRIANDPDENYRFFVNDFVSLQAALAPVVGAVCNTVVVPAPPRSGDIETNDPAEVDVVLIAGPNHQVVAGGTLTYNIVVTNRGPGRTRDVTINVPFNPTLTAVAGASFTSDTAWVSELGDDYFEIKTGAIGSGGAVMTATVELVVSPNAPLDASLAVRGSFEWDDDDDDGSSFTNATIVTIGGQNINRDVYIMPVSPARATLGTNINFVSEIFVPEEPIGIWVEASTGQNLEVGTFNAGENGGIDFTLLTGNLITGRHKLVMQGLWSNFASVGEFELE
jgi:hypothetical protein